jgi:hypothetical protein
MSAGACASPMRRWPRNRQGGDRERMSRTTQLFQSALLSCLFFAVIGVLGLRYARTVALAKEDETARWRQDQKYGTLRTQAVSRADFCIPSSPWYYHRLESLPAVGDRAHLIAVVPVGQTYEVLVKGGLTGRLPDKAYGPMRRGYLAYMFEMRYQRWIESNDGYRIVERRTYGSVRMAKILSPVDMSLELGPPDALPLDDLACPEPGTGIAVAAVCPVAEAMLGGGAKAVADEPTSRGFLEQDLLSGKSVRLTYIDGVGVSSLEPLGWTLTKPVAAHLFSQTILPPPLPTSDPLGRELVDFAVLPAQFTAFLDPTRFLLDQHEIAIRSVAGINESGVGYELSLRPWDRDANGYAGPEDRSRAVIPLGRLQYDPDRKIVIRALIEWPLYALHLSDDRLCFEGDYQKPPVLTVQYYGRAY